MFLKFFKVSVALIGLLRQGFKVSKASVELFFKIEQVIYKSAALLSLLGVAELVGYHINRSNLKLLFECNGAHYF